MLRSSCDEFQHEHVIAIIYESLRKASKCHGKIYGPFVHQLLVPRDILFSKYDRIPDIDLWFPRDRDYSNFISAMGDKMMRELFEHHSLYKRNRFIARFNIFISETFPADDLDINTLSYYFDENDQLIPTSHRNIHPNVLVTNIRHKVAHMLQDYPQRVLDNDFEINKLNQMYLSQGYTVLLPDNTPLISNEIESSVRRYFTRMESLPTVSSDVDTGKAQAVDEFLFAIDALRIASTKLVSMLLKS